MSYTSANEIVMIHPFHADDEISPTSTDILATAADFPREDDVQHPASTSKIYAL